MSFIQKILTPFAGKKLILLLATAFSILTGMAQHSTKFSGEWKLNESKSDSVRQFPLCIFGGGDRMRSRTMKISGHADFFTIDVASESADGALVTRQEKLAFDGEKTDITFVGRPRDTSSARWSDDGQMTVISVRSLTKNGEKADFTVTETWNLSNDGTSISVCVNSVPISGSEHTMKLVYDKQMAADYRF